VVRPTWPGDYIAAVMAWFMARTPAAGPSGWAQTAPTTARKVAPAWTKGAQFWGVMPPMATQGSSMSSDHQAIRPGLGGGILGGGGEKRAERDVVRAVLAGLHREVPAVVAGDAEGEGGADEGAGFACRGVGLADMDAVGPMGVDEIGAVIEEEGDAAGLGDGAERVDGAAPVVVVGLLEAQLDGRHIARVQGAGERFGEVGAGGGGGDEIKLAVGHQSLTLDAADRLLAYIPTAGPCWTAWMTGSSPTMTYGDRSAIRRACRFR
jgi:hypothetical protein